MKKNVSKRNFVFAEPITEERIPEIDLYMDQVLTFLSERLVQGGSDKVLTKTMINNYSKDKLLPPSKNKKYTKEHIILLIMIYNLKSVLTISDIEIIMKMLYKNASKDISEVYGGFVEKQASIQSCVKDEFSDIFAILNSEKTDKSKKDAIDAALRLSLEANMRKQLAESLVDYIGLPNEKEKTSI